MAANPDWANKDFYKVLGVAKDADRATIKKTYHKLSKQYHPDSRPGDKDAEAKFKEISEAYSVLSDKDQREEYDQIRAMGSGGARFQAPGSGGAGGFEDVFSRFGGGTRGSYQQADFDDLFSMFGQQSGGFGSGRFGQSTGGFRGYGGPQRGADVTARTTLDFQTAVKGETISLAGEDGKPFKVKIPAGTPSGRTLRVRGKGLVTSKRTGVPMSESSESAAKAAELLQQTDRLIKTVPEVASVFGKVGRAELLEAESKSYHGPGTCTFYGTANSNQMLMEIMGFHLPGASFIHPGTPLRDIAIASGMGAVMLGGGMVLYTLGSRVVPAAEATLLTIIEVMLGPFWVWLVLGETASTNTLIGGGFLIGAVALNALTGVRRAVPAI